MMQRRYIVVEGPIGVGKSSLARQLANYLGWSFFAEDASANPFLSRFCSDMSRYALATQLAFLAQRADLVHEIQVEGRFPTRIVADFLFEKDALFSAINLEDNERALYQKIAPRVLPHYPIPDLVIYLQESQETLLERTAARIKRGEMSLPEVYLKKVHAAYSEFFHQYNKAPLLIVNTDHLNFSENPEDFELLLRCISEQRGQRHYFNKSA